MVLNRSINVYLKIDIYVYFFVHADAISVLLVGHYSFGVRVAVCNLALVTTHSRLPFWILQFRNVASRDWTTLQNEFSVNVFALMSLVHQFIFNS